jgi:hypothetical protein
MFVACWSLVSLISRFFLAFIQFDSVCHGIDAVGVFLHHLWLRMVQCVARWFRWMSLWCTSQGFNNWQMGEIPRCNDCNAYIQYNWSLVCLMWFVWVTKNRVPVVRIDSHRFENNFMNREAVRSGSVPLRFVSRPVHGFIRFHSVRFLSGIDCVIAFYKGSVCGNVNVMCIAAFKLYPLVFVTFWKQHWPSKLLRRESTEN